MLVLSDVESLMDCTLWISFSGGGKPRLTTLGEGALGSENLELQEWRVITRGCLNATCCAGQTVVANDFSYGVEWPNSVA